MTGDRITQAIAVEWDQISLALGANLSKFESDLTPLLRDLDEHPNDQKTIAAIFELFGKFPTANGILQASLSRSGSPAKGSGEQDTPRQKLRYTSIPVFFGTSRERTGYDEPARFFGANRAANSFGLAEVSIPDDHRMGNLEKPSWFKLQFRADPARHVLILSLQPLDRSQFVERTRSALAVTKKEVLVFIHGYNVTFEDAARRAAQLAYDLQFEGLPAFYSWPSEASFTKYLIDANNATWVEPHFRDFLTLLRSEVGADTIHIIAHSMGNRLIANTLAGMSSVTTAGMARLRQIVFAAPDIDADTFRQMAGAFSGKAERLTLYASSGDRALVASQEFQKYPRAGQSGLDLVIVPDIDTIDAGAVNTEFLGHSYFGDSQSVLSDLFYLIRNGTAPGERARLQKQQLYGAIYWAFRH